MQGLFSFRHTILVFAISSNSISFSQESPRVTPTVKLIERFEPSVVTLFSKSGNQVLGSGSGAFIHADGFILTNFHVVQRFNGFAVLPDGQVTEFRYVGSVPERDIAIVQAKLKEPAMPIPLGRSHDVRNGEPIIAAGNPGGRGVVFSSGIVSSKGIMTDAGNVLVMSQFRGSKRDLAIQFDAASNRGNSGGPLINAEGRQIGVVASKQFGEENINYAIPIDLVRSVLSGALAAEPSGDVWAGVTIDCLSDVPTVTDIVKDSPGDEIGLQAGDVLQAWNNKPLVTGIDWDLMLFSSKAGDEVELKWSRDGVENRSTVKLAKYQSLFPSSVLAANDADFDAGLKFSFYWLSDPFLIPDFRKLKAEREGITPNLDLSAVSEGRADEYGVVYEGLIRIEKPGLYRLAIASDDGSKLFLNDRLFIDHDGNHPAYERGRLERFETGFHTVRIEYFQGKGDRSLSLSLEEMGSAIPVKIPIKFYRDATGQTAQRPTD